MKLLFPILLLSIIVVSPGTNAQESQWITHYEKSGFTETPRYHETVEFCKRLAKYSDMVHFTTFGTSPQGRELPLLVIDKHKKFEPGTPDKTVILIQAGIHPGESDGKDAGLMLIRDMVVHGQHLELLDNITLLFIPVFNVDGHERFGPYNRINQNGPTEMGWRTTAKNLNLNRDHIKADAPEMQAWLKFFNHWKPHFFIDSHTTNGADYQYPLTYMLETMGNMDEGLTDWQTEIFEPAIKDKMLHAGYPIFPYVQFRKWYDPRSGLRTGPAPGMLSNGYSALLNRPGLLVETHMLKDYKTRVESTYQMILHTMEILHEHGKTLRELINKADEYAASSSFRQQEFPLGFTVSPTDSVMVEFLGVEYDVETSPVTGGPWFIYYPDKPVTYTLPLFEYNVPSATVFLPEAYIIPVEWSLVIERMRLHEIDMHIINKPLEIEIETYRFTNPVWRATPYEGRHTVAVSSAPMKEFRKFEPGSVIVPMNQPSARLIAHMLEPGSIDSFLQWGFFNAIFEQKEYAETYVMEPLAQQMLAESEDLRREFEKMKLNNPDFARSHWNMLNWFYSKTPWWDQRKNVYPVGRIHNLEGIVYR